MRIFTKSLQLCNWISSNQAMIFSSKRNIVFPTVNLCAAKMLLISKINIRKIEISYHINVRLVVSFATSPGLRDSDHRSSRYDRFRAGWSKMHGCSSFFRKESLTFRTPFLFLRFKISK